MPIRKLPNGKYRWGNHGAEYDSRAGAERQAAAAHANGYEGKEIMPDVGADQEIHDERGDIVALQQATRLLQRVLAHERLEQGTPHHAAPPASPSHAAAPHASPAIPKRPGAVAPPTPATAEHKTIDTSPYPPSEEDLYNHTYRSGRMRKAKPKSGMHANPNRSRSGEMIDSKPYPPTVKELLAQVKKAYADLTPIATLNLADTRLDQGAIPHQTRQAARDVHAGAKTAHRIATSPAAKKIVGGAARGAKKLLHLDADTAQLDEGGTSLFNAADVPAYRQLVARAGKQQGWTPKSHKQWWNSIQKHAANADFDPAQLDNGVMQHCMQRMEGHVDNPGAFCSWAKSEATGKHANAGEHKAGMPRSAGDPTPAKADAYVHDTGGAPRAYGNLPRTASGKPKSIGKAVNSIDPPQKVRTFYDADAKPRGLPRDLTRALNQAVAASEQIVQDYWER